MTQEELLRLHGDLCHSAGVLMKRKNNDYAHGMDPFANFRAAEVFGVDPRIGLLLRLQDKLKRLYTFADKGALSVDGEGWRDSVLDVINYAVLYAGLCLDETPKTVPDGDWLEPFDLGDAIRQHVRSDAVRHVDSQHYSEDHQ